MAQADSGLPLPKVAFWNVKKTAVKTSQSRPSKRQIPISGPGKAALTTWWLRQIFLWRAWRAPLLGHFARQEHWDLEFRRVVLAGFGCFFLTFQ